MRKWWSRFKRWINNKGSSSSKGTNSAGRRVAVPATSRNPDSPKVERIAIIIGHNATAQGAINYLGESEYKWNSKVAKLLEERFKVEGKELRVFKRTTEGRTEVAKQAAAWKPDLSLELHFNSYTKVAYGCEILIHKYARNYQHTQVIADELTDELAKRFNLKQRASNGVKVLKDRDRGAYNLRSLIDRQVKYVLLIEPCFGNLENPESKQIMENPDQYADVIANYLKTL